MSARYRRDARVDVLVAQQAARRPDATAVVLATTSGGTAAALTYAQLDRRANALAHQLRARGVARGTLVAVYMDRAVETVIAMLGILRASAAYVPLDPGYPAARLALMLEDTAAPLVLTQSALAARLPAGVEILVLDRGWGADQERGDAPAITGSADDLAYVIYTSGSTGRPKGVMVPHRGIVRLLFEQSFTPLDDRRVLLQLAPVSFDAATLEIWGPLVHGGRCVIYPTSGMPDARELGAVLRGHGVTTLWLTSSLFNLIIDQAPEALRGVPEILAGGEALSVAHIRKAQQLLPDVQLINGYGPTESTTFTCCYRIPRPVPAAWTAIPIGPPIAHTQVHLLDDAMQPVPDGAEGDLYIAGDGLARGYLNRPELTAERFLDVVVAGVPTRVYASGDRAVRRPDGALDFRGRVDDQVKVRGFRIELGEIETTLTEAPGVRACALAVREDSPGDKQLVAYVVPEAGAAPTAGSLRTALEARLPEYMVPGVFVLLEALPLSPNGKVDRAALPAPGRERPELEQPYAAPRGPLETLIADLWRRELALDRVGRDDRFFELGGTSLKAARFVAALSAELGTQVPIVAFFEAPTVATIAAVLARDFAPVIEQRFGGAVGDATRALRTRPMARARQADSDGPIAIVGMSGRFSSAPDLEQFWHNLATGVEARKPVTAEDLARVGLDPRWIDDEDYVASSFTLEEAECFDAAFFGYTPREAELMDPQQRLFLECAHAALEDAAYDPERTDAIIGVFGGVGRNAYLLGNISSHPRYREQLIEHAFQIGNERDFPCTHVAYKLDLHGPAVTVQTACSTSGVALHMAAQSLRAGECDIALVGGCKVLVPTHAGYWYVDGGALAPDGKVRAFDASAAGMVRGSGGAMLALRRLDDAVRARDNIRALIVGSAVNNDGAAKIGFTAPSVPGQAAVIRAAQQAAGITGDDLDYIETHGTGTIIGDPMEVAGLTQAFRETTTRRGFCALGSVKTNIGHLDAGATAAGIVKTVLAMERETLPPSLNFETPNPRIDWHDSPFFVNAALRPWPRGQRRRRAGVSSFGLGGTNAHIILEEAPVLAPSGPGRKEQLVLLSAKTPMALDRAAENLARRLDDDATLSLDDVAYTLAVGRRQLPVRRAIACAGRAQLLEALRGQAPRRVTGGTVAGEVGSVVFMFPGGGAQYAGMGRGLYDGEAVYRDAIDECARAVRDRVGRDIREVMFDDDASAIERPSLALPTLFAAEYALARLWRSLGLEPAALIGHSMGEYTAACLAGVMSMNDAAQLVTVRGQLFETLPRGGMLSVPLGVEDARRYAGDGLDVAAANRADGCVLSGEVAAIEAALAALTADGVEARRVHIDVAAHSRLVEPILDEFRAFVATIPLSPPRRPVISNVTGDWMTADEACSPDYWARHLRQTVRFADGLTTLLGETRALIEVGPGQTLASFARQHPTRARVQLAVPSLRHPKESDADTAFFARTLGKLWCAGVTVDWPAYYAGQDRRRVSLPTYPFERVRHWIDAAPAQPDIGAPTTLGHDPAVPPAVPAEVFAPASVAEIPPLPAEPAPVAQQGTDPSMSRKQRITEELKRIICDLSGVPVSDIDEHATFLELGFDSLFLAQANAGFRKRFGVKTTVRELIESMPVLDAVAAHIDEKLAPDVQVGEPAATPAPAGQAVPPAPAPGAPATIQPAAPATMPAMPTVALPAMPAASAGPLQQLIAQQLQLMQQQLAMLGGAVAQLPAPAAQAQPVQPQATQQQVAQAPTAPPQPPQSAPPPAARPAPVRAEDADSDRKSAKQSPWSPVSKDDRGSADDGLTREQKAHIDELIARVCARAPRSKELVQRHRAHLADPRTVQGFKLPYKEMVFPIVAARTQGSKIWDLDGNEYIDLVNGYGVTFLGHSPDFITDAVKKQLDRGVEIGPQNHLVGKLAELVCELTGMDRAAFCNTGSEAVLAALRLARTVTGRDKIVTFKGHYHGIFDEVLVKGVTMAGRRRTVPIAPGIPGWKVQNTIVVDYGDPASLDVIRQNAGDIALVLVEPVRSRNPDNQPVEFMRALRKVTEELDIPLLFDEMVTGFRCHPGGAQAYFGIRADLATYGKVVGGGYPIGVVTGTRRFMDALDGGFWQYGDDSVPEADMTWFAGTFVRHPVAMASAYATLSYLKTQGPALQASLNARTTAFVNELNGHFQDTGTPIWLEHFSSFFVVTYADFQEHSPLLYYHLHNRGVYTYEGRPAFFTTAHSDADMEKVIEAFKGSVAALQRVQLFPGLPYDDQERRIPLAEGQQEIWLATRFGHDASCAFNLCSTLELRGELDLELLRKAMLQLVRRHEALRCVPDADGTTQRVVPADSVDAPLIDLSSLSDLQRRQRVDELKHAEVTTEMDLERGPLHRFVIIRLGPAHHLILLTVHHIIADGWSCGVLMRDLGTLYGALASGKPHGLGAPMPYSEWIALEADAGEGSARAASEDYWLTEFADAVPVLELPTDRPRPAMKTFTAERISLQLDTELTRSLRKMAGKQGATLFVGVLAGFHALLYRLSGQTDLVVGFSLAGQSSIEGRDLVGHCVNFLPLRTRIDENATFADHVKQLRGKVFDAFDHQSFTFGTLVKRLNLARDPSRTPLISVAFNLDPSTLGVSFHDLECVAGSVPRRYENLDIFFNLVESASGLEIQCTFNTDLWDRDTMQRRLAEYREILTGAIADPARPMARLPMLPEAELTRLLHTWNATDEAFPADRCLHELIAGQAAKVPDAVAVRAGDETLTYGALLARAGQLGRHLQKLGVGPDQRVAICMRRTVDLPVALLATLAAGGAYVPIDPDNPRERVAFLLEDAGARVALTQRELAAGLPASGIEVLSVDALPASVASEPAELPTTGVGPDDLAYINYTSGSTGKPKGVMVSHRALVCYLSWAMRRYHMDAGSGAPVHSSIGFDLTITGLWGPLLHGKTVTLLPEDAGVGPLAAALRDPGGFSLVKLTPAHLAILEHELAGAELPTSAGTFVVGGEQLTGEHVAFLQRHAPNIAVINEYGPTEATVGCCIYQVRPDERHPGAIPIGKPAPNTRLYILDRHGNPAPVGVPGELYIGGAQLARGYWRRPELTAERFVANPLGTPDERLYRTGDLARWRADGNIEFLGRTDHQVKVRGYRIELGEIEAALAAHPAIDEAVVVKRDDALAAYVVPALDDEGNLKEATREHAEDWKKRWAALYSAGAAEVASGAEQVDDLVLLRQLSDRGGYEEEVQEGLDQTFERLRALPLERVWAIGCGTGAVLLRLAPHCGRIFGTDYAEGGIAEIRRLLATPAHQDKTNVEVEVRDAADFRGIEPGSFTSVLINSVCQYFPSGAYFREVLRGAVEATAPGGQVFIGDVQSLALLSAHHAFDQLQRSPEATPTAELRQLVRQRVLTEDELVVDPGFFHALQAELPRIGHIELRLRRGDIQNETTRFHYDVWLHVGPAPALVDAPAWRDWRREKLTVERVREILAGEAPELLCLADVPNWRVQKHVAAARLLEDPAAPATAGAIAAAVEAAPAGVDPMVLWALADELGYRADIRWTDVGDDGDMDVVLVRKRGNGAHADTGPLVRPRRAPVETGRWWTRYASSPMAKRLERRLTALVRADLEKTLPDYMIPASFTAMDALPLTVSGKIDRDALPRIDRPATARRGFVPPSTPLARQIAGVWAEVLRVDQVGLHDNFFELGGHSLLGIQVIVRLRDALGLDELSLSSLFETPTVEALSERIEALRYVKEGAARGATEEREEFTF